MTGERSVLTDGATVTRTSFAPTASAGLRLTTETPFTSLSSCMITCSKGADSIADHDRDAAEVLVLAPLGATASE